MTTVVTDIYRFIDPFHDDVKRRMTLMQMSLQGLFLTTIDSSRILWLAMKRHCNRLHCPPRFQAIRNVNE